MEKGSFIAFYDSTVYSGFKKNNRNYIDASKSRLKKVALQKILPFPHLKINNVNKTMGPISPLTQTSITSILHF